MDADGRLGPRGRCDDRPLHSRKTIRGLDDVPPKIRAYTEKHHPEYFDAPKDWDVSGPILSSWEAYARDTPREA